MSLRRGTCQWCGRSSRHSSGATSTCSSRALACCTGSLASPARTVGCCWDGCRRAPKKDVDTVAASAMPGLERLGSASISRSYAASAPALCEVVAFIACGTTSLGLGANARRGRTLYCNTDLIESLGFFSLGAYLENSRAFSDRLQAESTYLKMHVNFLDRRPS